MVRKKHGTDLQKKMVFILQCACVNSFDKIYTNHVILT